MEDLRKYKLRGSPDCPIDVYRTTRKLRHRTFTHWHPELELTLVEEGTTVYRLDNQEQALTLHPDDILIIPPNTLHGQYAYTPEIITWSIVINAEAIAMPPTHIFQKAFVEPLQQGRLGMPTLLHPGDPAHTVLFPLMQQLKNGWNYADNYKINRFATAIAICTALLPFCHIVEATAVSVQQYRRSVGECMRYIQSNYSQRLTLAVLAEQVQLHPNYLCTLFKEHTGQTVVEYITKIRIEAATELLLTTDLPTNKVAERCGFRSECLLYKNFKAIMGMTPNAYRKQQRRIPS